MLLLFTVSVLPFSAMFVQPNIGEALEIIGSSEKFGFFVHLLHHVWLLGSETFSFAAYFFLLVVSPLSQSRQPWGMRNEYSESLSCDGWGLPGSQSNFSLHVPPWI